MITLAQYQRTALKVVMVVIVLGLVWFVLFHNLLPDLFSVYPPFSLIYFSFILLIAFYLYKALSLPLEKADQISRALQHNEKKYRSLVEEINEVLFVIDHMGRITYISPSVTLLVGFKPQEMIGRLFLEFIAPEDEELVFNAFKERQRGKVAPMQYRILTKEGATRWVRSLSKPYKTESGEIGIRGVLMDITDMVEKDLALMESEARWRALVQQAPDYIITTDLNGKIEFVNRNFFSIPQEHVIGQMIYDLAPARSMKSIKEAIRQVVEKGASQRFEIALENEGQKHWYLVRSGPIKKNEKIVGLTFIATDVTRNKNYEQELQEIRAHLQELLSQRTLELKSANQEIKSLDKLIADKLPKFERLLSDFIDRIATCAAKNNTTDLQEIQKEAETLKMQFKKIYKELMKHKKDLK